MVYLIQFLPMFFFVYNLLGVGFAFKNIEFTAMSYCFEILKNQNPIYKYNTDFI